MSNAKLIAITAPPGKVAAAPTPDEGRSPPRWLADWSPAEAVPVPAATVAAALERVRRALAPCDPQELAIKLDQTMQLWRLPQGWDTVAEFYVEALEILPTDLLDLALKRVRLGHKYPEAPKPADFVEAVADELAARRLTKLRLETAMSKIRAEEAKSRRLRERPETAAVEPRTDAGAVVAGAVRRMEPGQRCMNEPGAAEQEAEFQRRRQQMLAEMAADPDFAAVMDR